jgi:hypothetical protein
LPTRIAGLVQTRSGGVEMDALPVPICLEHGEPERGFARAENSTDQSFLVIDVPKAIAASGDIELVRWTVVRKDDICAYAVHWAPGSVSKSETSPQVKRSPSQDQKQHNKQEAFEASPEPAGAGKQVRDFLYREIEVIGAAQIQHPCTTI